MEIYQLQYFLAIAENGSFTKASAALYVSQPSLSSGIKKLEKELWDAADELSARPDFFDPDLSG